MLTDLPVHRWLVFDDSWPAATVDFLLNFLEVGTEEVVYDPFVGCGTTPVVCAGYGLSTYSADISSLAILTTKVKLTAWSQNVIDTTEAVIKSEGIETLLHDFVHRALKEKQRDIPVELIQFVLAATLLRGGWHKGVAIQVAELQNRAIELINEIRSDTFSLTKTKLSHATNCSDFHLIDPMEIHSLAQDNLVFVSSPPFYGSNTNPAKQRIANLINENNNLKSRVSPPKTWVLSNASSILENISIDNPKYSMIYEYLFFLNSIVEHVAKLGCRAAALEMGPKWLDGKLVRFDSFIAELLLQHNYQITLFKKGSEAAAEEITLICAERL